MNDSYGVLHGGDGAVTETILLFRILGLHSLCAESIYHISCCSLRSQKPLNKDDQSCMVPLSSCPVNSLRPRPNRRHFADDIFKCISDNENEWILPRISLTFVPKVRINNIPALVQIMAWRRPGDKPLSEPMMVSLLTHICVARPQWVKLTEAEWRIHASIN